MKRICVIGAGISGLSVAKMLDTSIFEIDVLEKNDNIGGIARTKTVNGIPYHTVGGHCFNSKNIDVIEFVFNKILLAENWNLVGRKSNIMFMNHYIPYPIEFAVKEIYKFDKLLAFNITNDFLNTKPMKPTNLEEWFCQNFGTTLAEKYFIPYNRKIWQIDPSAMSHEWITGKLPMPNKMSLFNALFEDEADNMPHSKFYYPKSNNQNTFIDALAKDLDITTGFEVTRIENKEGSWIINDAEAYDIIINTMPLDKLPFVLKDTPDAIRKQSQKLKYNKVTNVLWKTKGVNSTWTYFPSKETIFHRHIHIGNFLSPPQNYSITESMGEHTFEEMVEYGEKIDYLLEPIDYNVSDYAYPVFDQNYKDSTQVIKDYLSSIGLYTLGRFGEWDYYNMDICIENAIKLSRRISNE